MAVPVLSLLTKHIMQGKERMLSMTEAKYTGRAVSIPLGLLEGLLNAVLITIIGTAVIAGITAKGIIQETQIGYAIMILLIAASWIGSLTTWRKTKRQKILVCFLSGGLYYCMLLLSTLLFFGGQYHGVGETALLIFCGSTLAVFVKLRRTNHRKRRKLKKRNG